LKERNGINGISQRNKILFLYGIAQAAFRVFVIVIGRVIAARTGTRYISI
jgi:hypothetical protein